MISAILFAEGGNADARTIKNRANAIFNNELYEFFKSEMSKRVKRVASGVFGADMRSEMSTDGPVTIVMNSDVLLKKG